MFFINAQLPVIVMLSWLSCPWHKHIGDRFSVCSTSTRDAPPSWFHRPEHGRKIDVYQIGGHCVSARANRKLRARRRGDDGGHRQNLCQVNRERGVPSCLANTRYELNQPPLSLHHLCYVQHTHLACHERGSEDRPIGLFRQDVISASTFLTKYLSILRLTTATTSRACGYVLVLKGRRVGQPTEGRIYFHGGDVGDSGDPPKGQQVWRPSGRKGPLFRLYLYLGARRLPP